jgi:hypothetical protein
VTTQFCSATIPLWDGLAFHVDGNSKVTRSNGSYDAPAPNAFSLPHVTTCPGSTERCRASCYVHGLKKYAPDVYATYEANERAVHAVLLDDRDADHAAVLLAGWVAVHARGGFRWHVSGDVFSTEYAHWIVDVCRRAPRVPFWIYTRTLAAVRVLELAGNLTVNVSADKDNFAAARDVAARSGAHLCYLVSAHDEVLPELPPGSVVFPDYPLRGRSLLVPTEAPWWRAITAEQKKMVCPADFFGQSEQNRCGPCKKCL